MLALGVRISGDGSCPQSRGIRRRLQLLHKNFHSRLLFRKTRKTTWLLEIRATVSVPILGLLAGWLRPMASDDVRQELTLKVLMVSNLSQPLACYHSAFLELTGCTQFLDAPQQRRDPLEKT